MSLTRALNQFDVPAFISRHSGRKESKSERSHEYLLTCPLCGSSRLRWNASKRAGAWKCWGCMRSGDTILLVQIMERTTQEGAIDFIMRGYVGGDQPTSLDPQSIAPRRVDEHREISAKLQMLPAIGWPAGVDLLAPVPQHDRAFEYLRARKHHSVDPSLLAPYRVGFGRMGRLDGYLVFPVFMDGALVYWQGRATWDPPTDLHATALRDWKESTSYRKTLNPVSTPGVATATDVIFGYDQARVAEHVVITEGPFDAVQIGLPGTTAGVALFGKAWSDQKLARLRRLPARRFTVYLDAGSEEWDSACRLAGGLSSYVPTYLATPPEGCDAGSLTPYLNASVIARAQPYRGQAPLQGLR